MPLSKEQAYTTHQRILHFLDRTIGNYIADNNGSCEVFPAPFSVHLFKNDEKYLEPDLSVICDSDKLNEKGCYGAPDWIIEIVSPGSKRMDYYTKLALYRAVGVREYWIVDPLRRVILIYDMEHDDGPVMYSFSDKIKVNIYDSLYIDFGELNVGLA